MDQDQLISTELERALRVEPSPEFLARVRQRLADERPLSAWRDGRRWAFGVVVLSFVFGSVLVVRRDPSTSLGAGHATPVQTQVAEDSGDARSTPVPNQEALAKDNSAAVLQHDHVVNTSSPLKSTVAPASPRRSPVTPRQEIAAFRELVTLAEAGRFNYQLAYEAVPVPDAISTADIVVPPITLLPIVPDEVLE